MAITKFGKSIYADIENTITELRNMHLIRDENGITQRCLSHTCSEFSFSEKNDSNKIMYDKHISCSYLIEELLKNRQYLVLLYDKSIIQAEFIVDGETIIKERLLFIKKHNKLWTKSEIDNSDALDEDWFSEEESIPILLRIDFDPQEHVECKHAASHLTLSNHESCRIPLKNAVSFSEFIQFILYHFYNTDLPGNKYKLPDDTITKEERKMLHINWE